VFAFVFLCLYFFCLFSFNLFGWEAFALAMFTHLFLPVRQSGRSFKRELKTNSQTEYCKKDLVLLNKGKKGDEHEVIIYEIWHKRRSEAKHREKVTVIQTLNEKKKKSKSCLDTILFALSIKKLLCSCM
jgi:hypothetical protein